MFGAAAVARHGKSRGWWRRLLPRHPVLPWTECLVTLGVVALVWLSVWMPLAQERRDAEQAAIEGTSNLARAFEENSDRIVSGIDQILLSARAAYAEDEAHFNIVDWANKRTRSDRFAFFIGRVDEHGITREATFKPAPPPIDISDREHFRAQLDPHRDELFISKPVTGRATRQSALQFTRKLLHADGSFAGIVQVSLNSSELSRFYETLQLGDGYVMLAGTDGVIRARGPLDESIIGSALAPAAAAAVAARQSGTFRATSPADGITRTVSFRRLRNYPLIVLVGFDDAHVFAHYQASRTHAIVTGVVISALVLLLGGFWVRQRQSSLRAKRSLRITLESINQGIVMIDVEGRVPVINGRAIAMLDLRPEMLTGSAGAAALRAFCLAPARPEDADLATLQDPARGGTPWPEAGAETGVFEIVHADGKIIEVQSNQVPSGGTVLTYSDITDRKVAEAHIHHLAHHDALTGLANRILLNHQLAAAVAEADGGAREAAGFAVLCLDLDGFKSINDRLGHDIGDLVLAKFAERVQGLLGPADMVARTGGDEFTVLQRGVTGPEATEALARRVVAALAEAVLVESYQLTVAVSVGIALCPADGVDARTLLRKADTALYRAKAAGRGTYCFFEASMDAHLLERQSLENDLRRALDRGELEVYFQPQFSCRTLQIAGFEALVRWQHPVRGFVPPSVFIPIAEERGLVKQLGQLVLEQACAHAASWRPQRRVAVNLSPIQFRDENLPALVSGILARTGLSPALLELEITEGVLISDEEQALQTLRALKTLGVRISLDDFGTGYAGLSYLRRLPFDKIKIDKSFVQAQQHDPATQAIMEAVLSMSRRLGLEVTAEGVETEEQLATIRQQRCTEVQGYLLGRPMPAAEVPALLERAAARRSGMAAYAEEADPRAARSAEEARRAAAVGRAVQAARL
jgi:diguanylate cyclase (GGDEF)-like protein